MLLRVGSRIWRKLGAIRYLSANENLTVRAGMHKNPGKVLFVENNSTVTYGEFLNRAGQYVALLDGKYGIAKGDRVLSRATKSLDTVALYIACLRLGAIYIPVNLAYTQSETKHYVTDSEPKLMVTCDEKTDSVFRELIPNVVREDSLSRQSRKENPNLDVENTSSSDVACVCYTSGTTGLPKGAMLTHGSLSENAEALVYLWRFSHDDKLLHMLPFYHVHGMFISLNCSLFSHSTVIWRDKFTVEDALEWLPQSTVMMGVPTYYSRLVSSQHFSFNSNYHKHMRLFVSGSAPLSPQIWDRFKQITGKPILERYGMTEAQVICSNLYEPEYRIPGSVGRPVNGTKLRLNEAGGIEIQSNSLFAGYWKNPEKTKQEFTSDGYFITGDVGDIDEKGFVRILGRSKDLIITGGLNVYPKEVEDVLDKIEGVRESAIVGVPHRDFGEAVLAVVAPEIWPQKGEQLSSLSQQIILNLRNRLAGYKVPKDIVFLSELPRNSMAKVQKNVLREQFKETFVNSNGL